MKSWLSGTLILGLGFATIVGACGDDTPDETGEGGSAATQSTTSTGGDSSTNTGGNTGTGGSAGCAEVTGISDFQPFFFAGTWYGQTVDMLGGADPDYLEVDITEDASGAVSLSLPANINDCADTASCVIVTEDEGEMAIGAWFMSTSGTLTVDSYTAPYYVDGSLTDIQLVEVTFDEESGDVTAVPGGRCVNVASLDFLLEPPTPNWTCNPAYYEDGMDCDCECGDVDPDCAMSGTELYGCADGQTCGATGECEGTPTAWTCAPTDYDAGMANGCQCGCGIGDPDCEIMGAAVVGCGGGELCSAASTCYPDTWTCNPTYYNSGIMDDCDCGCGALDLDCADATVGSCHYCDLMGSCSTDACPGTINPASNGVCQ